MRNPSKLLAGLCLLAMGPAVMANRWPKPGPPRGPYPNWTVTGYGETLQDAETNALDNAGQSIADYLSKNYPALAWTPPGDYLKRYQIVRSEGGPANKDLERSGLMTEVNLRVEITPKLLEDALRMSRRPRMVDRQHVLALGLGGVMGILMVLGGYLGLEEATRGSHTRLLRWTAAGLLTIIGLGVWLLLPVHGAYLFW